MSNYAHSFELIKSENTLLPWDCSICYSVPLWHIFQSIYCKEKRCRPCTEKGEVALVLMGAVMLDRAEGMKALTWAHFVRNEGFNAGLVHLLPPLGYLQTTPLSPPFREVASQTANPPNYQDILGALRNYWCKTGCTANNGNLELLARRICVAITVNFQADGRTWQGIRV
jgi:hypothetical protein